MANTDVEIRISVTNGGCNIEAGMYPIKAPLHIEITPNKLYFTYISLKFVVSRFKAVRKSKLKLFGKIFLGTFSISSNSSFK